MFRFKRFAVGQSGAAMKVGTDGVLLGAWCPLENRPARVLDVGTGTGLIALMIAQRGEAWGCRVDAVEIDQSAFEQAHDNFAASPWADRLVAHHADIQHFAPEYDYDLVISNPPFYNNSLMPPEERRAMARHTATLDFDRLAGCAAAVGRELAVIIPAEQTSDFVSIAAGYGFHLARQTCVYSVPGRPARRSLLAFGRTAVEPMRDTLVIEQSGRHRYTPEYRELTKDFYLKF